MWKTTLLTAYLLLAWCTLSAQTIKVQPYLQQATPHSIYILWETDSGAESTIDWGLTEALGNTASGISFISEGEARIHEVQLTGLDRFTTYYYRVRTGGTQSEIASFKTPPFASDQENFRLIAMSDMQIDGANPNKFAEIVQDGILDYLAEEPEGTLTDNLALIMIPGDLVQNGHNFSQWEDHFFDPAQSLFNQVPVYPVPGNHENNAVYFFRYFHLPENGSEGFEEHWWYHDYGNIRIIGLDSNGPYDGPTQLDWLEDVLATTCAADSIDFVFAQLHHPHKSELWTPGEADFTGEVITQLEQFSSGCGKPSIHFFGHTHGYSRGQSRDHKHLWINVATAGGAIDNWGEFPQFDYDEFTVSQDEWGFVSVEVTAGDTPEFTIKRISRGNEANFMDNVLRDSLRIQKSHQTITIPNPIFPINEMVNPECVILKASAFDSATGLSHGQSHWQIAPTCDDFSTPVVDRWKTYQNLYYNEDTQAEDDLTDEQITGLNPNSTYCWRARYRDRQLNWSEWSEPTPFSTDASPFSPNLLINPGAENQLMQWVLAEGTTEALTDGECNGISPQSGDYYFAVGGVCEDGAFGRCLQNVSLAAYADDIAAGQLQVNFGGYLSNYNGSDQPSMRLLFLTENADIIDSTAFLTTLNSNWTLFSEWAAIPSNTGIIQFELRGTRNAGSDNDSYFDDLFLRLGSEEVDCDQFVVSTHHVPSTIINLTAFPNPWSSSTRIRVPDLSGDNYHIAVFNNLGQQLPCTTQILPGEIRLERGQLSPGVYHFVVEQGQERLGRGRFVVQ